MGAVHDPAGISIRVHTDCIEITVLLLGSVCLWYVSVNAYRRQGTEFDAMPNVSSVPPATSISLYTSNSSISLLATLDVYAVLWPRSQPRVCRKDCARELLM